MRDLRRKYIRSLFIVIGLVILPCLIVPSFCQINQGKLALSKIPLCFNFQDTLRRVRGEQIPGIKGKALLSNLCALIDRFPNLTIEDFTQLFPTLSSISGSNIADRKLSKDELGEFLNSIPKISETQIIFNYDRYSERYDASVASDTLGNVLDLFEQYFIHILNVSGASGTTEPIFKLAQYLDAAESIALESQHMLGSSKAVRNEQAIEEHRLFFASESDTARCENIARDYFRGEKLSLQDREFVMASVYIMLGNYTLLEDSLVDRVEGNLFVLLSTLAQDTTTKDSINRVKDIIETMPLEQAVKDKTLSLFTLTPKQFRSQYNPAIFEGMVDHVIVTDLTGRIVYVNRSLINTFGLAEKDIIGKPLSEIIGEERFVGFTQAVQDALSGNPLPAIEYQVNKPGEEEGVALFSANFSILKDSKGIPIGVVGIARDITELVDSSMKDHLTGVWNRRYFDEELTRAIAWANRYSKPVSLLMIDIDNFKLVNDTRGHSFGDRVLQEIARIINGNLRTTDVLSRYGEYTLSRYGGEEFAIILPNTNSEGAAMVAERIRQLIEGIIVEDLFNLTVSIGVATYPNLANDEATLIQNADTALYASKQGGKNRVTVFIQEGN